jgi:hypothetical protein
MNTTLIRSLTLASGFLALALICPAAAQDSARDQSSADPSGSNKQYDAYAFLIGEWDVKASEDGPAAAVIRVRWGPNRSYIWYATTLLFGGHEEPHLEGMLVWNATQKNLDMLFSMDLKSGRVQEHGTMSVDADGVIVRDITAVYGAGANAIGRPPIGPEGATAHFRETYKKLGPDKILTSGMRKTESGWVETFPGSDHLIMIRRPSQPD